MKRILLTIVSVTTAVLNRATALQQSRFGAQTSWICICWEVTDSKYVGAAR